MMEDRNKRRSWPLVVVLLANWLALAGTFAFAPMWFELSGPWASMWDEFDLEPPSVTTLVSDAWDLLVSRYAIVSAPVTVGLIAVNIFVLRYCVKKSEIAWWTVRLLLVVLPLVGIVPIVFGIYVAPRRQLADVLDLERLPRYDMFPSYTATALDTDETLEERRRAMYAIQVMCMLEKAGISPPADRQRDSTSAAAKAYLLFMTHEDVPLELRLFAAGNLHHAFIKGRLSQYPEDALVDRDTARQQVAEIFLDVVQDGGPAGYDAWRRSGYQPGQWAESAFNNLAVNREIVSQLANCLASQTDAVRAEAAAALGAIGSTEIDMQVLEALEAINEDPNRRVRELAARAIREIRDTASSGDEAVQPDHAPNFENGGKCSLTNELSEARSPVDGGQCMCGDTRNSRIEGGLFGNCRNLSYSSTLHWLAAQVG